MSFLLHALKANQEIHDALMARTPELRVKGARGAGGDLSSGADLLAEEIFIRHLSSFGQIESEEAGILPQSREDGRRVLIDPLDGSENYLLGFPYYGTSVALYEGERPLCSMVCNLSSLEVVMKEGTVRRCHKLFHPNQCAEWPFASASFGIFERAYAAPQLCSLLHGQRIKFRSPGAVALSLASAHRMDFVLLYGASREYDIAAGRHLCDDLFSHESGGVWLLCREEERFVALKALIFDQEDA